ncbi:hypothetical protein AVEN_187551-1 [Araneus ventricosus]|uniref:Uncharacterized protein n=1 Tax=Araneus ventricosus TaxID=182803 RepID=A0A4Y2GRK6_ARAVE|nr:hypothetical protein AVEN_187551-1 [Araneus ventricosus]
MLHSVCRETDYRSDVDSVPKESNTGNTYYGLVNKPETSPIAESMLHTVCRETGYRTDVDRMPKEINIGQLLRALRNHYTIFCMMFNFSFLALLERKLPLF